MKILKNKTGSALILILIIIGVLSLLGISILNVTVSNFKMKKTNTLLRSNLYIAEAGLEETYANLYVIIHEACEAANIEANRVIEEYSDQMDVYSENYIIKEAERSFEKQYKKYVQDSIQTLADKRNLAISSYSDNLNINITKTDGSSLKGVKFDANNMIIIKAVSTYMYDNVKKQVSSDIKIATPKYDEPYTISYDMRESDVAEIPLYPRITAKSVGCTVNIDYGSLLNFENWKIIS